MAADRLSPGTVLGKRFELERVAGAGGMGTVYRARDLATGAPAAVKVLASTTDSRRFAREARLLEKVEHDSIVRYVGEGTTGDGSPFLVMEWLDGEELVARLSRGCLGVEETLILARRVASALDALHDGGALHRDVKPSNLFLPGGRVEQVKLLDFGIAVGLDASRPITRSGTAVGTPGYMAPEQARGERDVDGRADLFSLGAVLFECLTGRPAFTGLHVIALLAKVLLEDVPRATTFRVDVPEALADLVAALLEKRREDRPPDAAAVLAMLDAVDVGQTARPPSLRPPRAPELTAGEQRLFSLILVGNAQPFAPARGGADAETMPVDAFRFFGPLREVATEYGAALAPLADGTFVLALGGSGAATDRAALAARCALSARAVAADAPIALAMGRGLSGASLPAGEVADRAAGLLAGLPRTVGAVSTTIRIDELTAGLLGDRFVVDGEGERRALRGERQHAGEDGRMFLGKRSLCVGRERELRALEEAFDTAVSEPCSRAVIVVADAGVGKSRLQAELFRVLDEKGIAIERWLARGDPSSSGSPFGQLGQAVRRAAGVLDGEPLEARRAKLLARVGRHLGAEARRVAEFLGELAGTPFPDEESPRLRAARHDPVSMGDQMRAAWVDWLDAECRAQPVVLVLEDLHWGDLPTVQFVDAALRLLADRPFVVVALARPEVATRFPGLWGKRAALTIHLGGLSKRSCAELARAILGDGASPATLDRLWEQSSGNAFFLEELLRAAVSGRDAGAPATVLAMVQARLEGLSAEARRVLRAGSIFGQRFWRGGITALLGGAPPDEILAALVDDEVIVRAREAKFPGEIEFAFRHALVREVAAGMLTEADRAVGHRLAAAWLSEAGEGDAKVLAECFERGGLRAEAAAFYRRAAEHAFEGTDHALVVTLAERARACAADAFDARGHGELYLLEAIANRFRGQPREMRAAAGEAATRLPRGSAPFCRALEAIAHASGLLHDSDALEQAMRDLLAADVRIDPDDLGSEATRELVTAYAISLARTGGHGILGGQAALGSVALRKSEEVARFLPDAPAITAALQRAQGLEMHLKGDLGATLRLHVAAHASFQAAGDVRNATIESANVGCAYVLLGALPEAEIALREAIAEGDRLGLISVRLTAHQDLGHAVALQGRFDEAIALEEQAVALARETGQRSYELSSRFYLARILLLSGDVERAESESRSQLEEQGALAGDRAHAFAILAGAAAAQNRLADALADATAAMEILTAEGEIEEGESLIRLGYAEALHASGDPRAPAAFESARASVLGRAAKIADIELRRSFLELVPENARILARAAELLAGRRDAPLKQV